MEREFRQNVLAWAAYLVAWLIWHGIAIRDVLALQGTGDWWIGPTIRIGTVGAALQVILCLLVIGERARGTLYVVGMAVLNPLVHAWIARDTIKEIGGDRFLKLCLDAMPNYVLSGLVALLAVALYRRTKIRAV